MNIREKTDKIIIHCTATKPSMDVGAYEIDRWHRQRGWLQIGYTLVIKRDGLIEAGRPLNVVGAHAKGHNSTSVSIALAGGVDEDNKPEDNFTEAQHASLKTALTFLRAMYPKAKVIGHNEVSTKACPSFDVQQYLKERNLRL